MASNKSFVSSLMVDDCDSYTSDETVQSKVIVTEVLAVKDDAFMVDKKYRCSGEGVDDVPGVDNVVSDGNKHLVMLEYGKIAFNRSHAKSVDDVAGNKDVNGSESKENHVDSVVKDKIFSFHEDVDSNVKKVNIKDDDGNVVVFDEKLFNGHEDVEISQQNYVVTGDKMLVSDEAVDSEPKNMLNVLMGDVDMVPVSNENMSNEMIEVVFVKETIIISDDDEEPVFGSYEKKAVSDYTFSSDDDDVQIVCVKNSNGKCCHDDPFSGGMPRMKRSKNHHRSPIALQFVLDEASEDEE
ncbi:hypothetical protein Tco_0994435 [Tanacetum coccineum]